MGTEMEVRGRTYVMPRPLWGGPETAETAEQVRGVGAGAKTPVI